MKVVISSDSTCDLSPELIEKYNIRMVPLFVSLGEDIYKDGINIDADKIYSYVAQTGVLPQTSAVNSSDYSEFFSNLVNQGYSVVHFSLSSEFSSTHENAVLAAQEFENVHVIDSRSLSTGQGLLVLRAAELAATGAYTAIQIFEDAMETRNKVDGSFVIDSLEYLVKGGRCSAVSMLGANVLKIKPEIVLRYGKMVPERKYRGSFEKVVARYIEDHLHEKEEIDTTRIILTHTKCSDTCIQGALDKIKEICPEFKEIIVTTAGSTITSHCGPNTLGIMFLRK